MSKDQRMTVIHTLQGDGSVTVQLTFYPKLAENEEQFNALPIERRMLNNAARDSGNAMVEMLKKRLAPSDKNV